MADLPLWRTEAHNLPLWPGAFAYVPRIYAPDGNAVLVQDAGDGWFYVDNDARTRCRSEVAVVALDHADTRAAFVRRLAVRLGCPAEAADEGVITFVDKVFVPAASRVDGKDYRDVRLMLMAGGTRGVDYIDDPVVWNQCVSVATDELCLALVRAWRSVEVQGG